MSGADVMQNMQQTVGDAWHFSNCESKKTIYTVLHGLVPSVPGGVARKTAHEGIAVFA